MRRLNERLARSMPGVGVMVPATIGTPQQDPNGILNSVSQDGNGWVTAEVDARLNHPHMSDGVVWGVSLLNPFGVTLSENIGDLFGFLSVEVQGVAGNGVSVGALLSNTTSMAAGQHIGMKAQSNGTGWQPFSIRAGVNQGGSGVHSAGLRRVVAQFAINSAADTMRCEPVWGLDASEAAIDAVAPITALTSYTGMDRVHFGVQTPGGVGGAAETVVFRPSVFLLTWAQLFESFALR